MTIRCTTTVSAAKMAAMSAKTSATGAVAAAALAAAALTGCSSSAPAPTRSSAPAELDPTTCQLAQSHTSGDLRLVCDRLTWTSSAGLWQWDEGDPNWQVTKSLVIRGEGRVWLADDDRSCVALRDLDAADAGTRVLCHPIEAEPGTWSTTAEPST